MNYKSIDKYLVMDVRTIGGGTKVIKIPNPAYYEVDEERLKRYEKTVKALEKI